MDALILAKEFKIATNHEVPIVADRLHWGLPVWVRDVFRPEIPPLPLYEIAIGSFSVVQEGKHYVLRGFEPGSRLASALRINEFEGDHVVEVRTTWYPEWRALWHAGLRIFIPAPRTVHH